MSALEEVLSRVRISEIYTALTGIAPRRTGRDTWRGPASWRDGDGYNVSMDDSGNVWHDFASGDDGGVLDLVQRLRGGNRADAFRWLADFAGVSLDDRPPSPAERDQWAEERRALERDLPEARYWRSLAVELMEGSLCLLKSQFFDPLEEDRPTGMELEHTTALLARVTRLEASALVTEYRWWRARYPGWTWAMVRAARAREQAELRALCRYLGFPESTVSAYLRTSEGPR